MHGDIMVGLPSRTVSKELHVIEGWKKRDIRGADPVFWKGGSYYKGVGFALGGRGPSESPNPSTDPPLRSLRAFKID